MKKYIDPDTGEELFSLPNPWIHGGEQICGLSDDNCEALGWLIVDEPPEPPRIPTKEDIRMERSMRYREEVDPLTAEFTRKTVTGAFADEAEKESMRAAMAEAAARIQAELPYPPEEKEVAHGRQ